MVQKQKLKLYLFQFLELLPVKTGDALYHSIQRKFQSSDLSFKFNSTKQTYLSFKRILKDAGIHLDGKKVLEIGSGWLPLIPYFLLFDGKVKQVKTYDLNRHYNGEEIKKLNNFFSRNTGNVISGVTGEFHLPEEIQYYPRADLINADFASTEMVFSRFVLEHVSRWEIERMHRHFKEQLPAGAHIIHFISPSDHRAYDDASLSLQDFLRYSEEEWKKRQTRFDYHNRLRLPEYISLFHKLGFELVHLEYDCPDKDSEIYKKFEAVPLHEDFEEFTEEELTAGSINIILRV